MTESWEQALDGLEAHVVRAEQIIAGMLPADSVESAGSVPWSPPTGLGPLPAEFVFRARTLLERQERLIAAIPQVLAETGKQRRLADRVGDATTNPTLPVYLDVTA